MTRRKQSGARKSGRSNGRANVNPGFNVLTYTGPIEQPILQQQPIVRLFGSAGALASDGSGNINFVVSNSPTPSADWSAISGLYAEARILGSVFRLLPLFPGYSTTSTPLLASVWVLGLIRNGGASAFPNLGQALTGVPRKILTTGERASMTYKMMGAIEASFFNTSGFTGTAAFTVTASGLTASSTYANYVIETLVQLRNPV